MITNVKKINPSSDYLFVFYRDNRFEEFNVFYINQKLDYDFFLIEHKERKVISENYELYQYFNQISPKNNFIKDFGKGLQPLVLNVQKIIIELDCYRIRIGIHWFFRPFSVSINQLRH